VDGSLPAQVLSTQLLCDGPDRRAPLSKCSVPTPPQRASRCRHGIGAGACEGCIGEKSDFTAVHTGYRGVFDHMYGETREKFKLHFRKQMALYLNEHNYQGGKPMEREDNFGSEMNDTTFDVTGEVRATLPLHSRYRMRLSAAPVYSWWLHPAGDPFDTASPQVFTTANQSLPIVNYTMIIVKAIVASDDGNPEYKPGMPGESVIVRDFEARSLLFPHGSGGRSASSPWGGSCCVVFRGSFRIERPKRGRLPQDGVPLRLPDGPHGQRRPLLGAVCMPLGSNALTLSPRM